MLSQRPAWQLPLWHGAARRGMPWRLSRAAVASPLARLNKRLCDRAAGQLFITHTIRSYGALLFATAMTTRQFLSVLLSCLLFQHPLSLGQWCGPLPILKCCLPSQCLTRICTVQG